MFQWRLKLREAKLAAGDERLDEASRLLAEPLLKQFLPAQRLAAQVAGKLVERARRHFASGQSAVGWLDLQVAENLGGHRADVDHARRDATDVVVQEAQQHLAAGEPQAAFDRLTALARRGARQRHVEELRELARSWCDAEQMAARGEIRAAISHLERIERRAQAMGTMELHSRVAHLTNEMRPHATEHEMATHQMHAAAAAERWSEALASADRVLALAPHDRVAQRVRRRAWQAIGLDATQHFQPHRAGHPISLRQQQMGDRARHISTRLGKASGEEDTVTGKPLPNRRLVWLDAVGGFLICLDNEVVLGQPSRDNPPAVPILADLSRRHAVLRREGGAYVLEPVQATRVDDREVTGPVTLGTNHHIQLGESVRIHFCRPHALSSTARLVIESHHKTEPSVDAVVLMAESCILGPRKHSHIRCRQWEHDLILFRQQGDLGCRAQTPLVVNGEQVTGPATIPAGSRIEGEDFALSIEEA